MKQIYVIKKNTQTLYNSIDTFRDHWNMSLLFLRFDENFIMWSRRVNHSSFDDDENNDDDDDKNDEDDESDKTQKKRQNSEKN
jgi:hypothetical protein